VTMRWWKKLQTDTSMPLSLAEASEWVSWISSIDFSRERQQAEIVLIPTRGVQKRGTMMMLRHERSWRLESNGIGK